MNNHIPECFYRVSIKALVLNETKDKFLIIQESTGWWELPGGGLDWGMTPQEDLPREIMEEMGVKTLEIAKNPSYFLTFSNKKATAWIANILYETILESYDFVASDECVAIRFVSKDDLGDLQLTSNVHALAHMFDPVKHVKDS